MVLKTNLAELLAKNLNASDIKTREEAEQRICLLQEGVRFGSLALSLQDTIVGGLEREQPLGMGYAGVTTKTDIELMYHFYQGEYCKRSVQVKDPVLGFIYDHFGPAAPRLHFVTQVLTGFKAVNHEGMGMMLRSPPKPREHRWPLLLSGARTVQEYKLRRTPIGIDLCCYMTDLTMGKNNNLMVSELPFGYVPEKELSCEHKEAYVALVG